MYTHHIVSWFSSTIGYDLVADVEILSGFTQNTDYLPSMSQVFNVTGSKLSNNLKITISEDFQFSFEGNLWEQFSFYNVGSSGSFVDDFFVRLNTNKTGLITGEIKFEAEGTETLIVPLNGFAYEPNLNFTKEELKFGLTSIDDESILTFQVDGTNLINDIEINTTSDDFEISFNGIDYQRNLLFPINTIDQTLPPTTIYVKFQPNNVETFDEAIEFRSGIFYSFVKLIGTAFNKSKVEFNETNTIVVSGNKDTTAISKTIKLSGSGLANLSDLFLSGDTNVKQYVKVEQIKPAPNNIYSIPTNILPYYDDGTLNIDVKIKRIPKPTTDVIFASLIIQGYDNFEKERLTFSTLPLKLEWL